MNLRDRLYTTLGPPQLVAGMTAGTMCRFLRAHARRIDPAYWPRVPPAFLATVLNSFIALLERAIWRRSIGRAEVREPLFVIGHWRSGTTHLHNLLAQDERYFAPTTFQAFNPHVFFLTERIRQPIDGLLIPKTRPMDNVKVGLEEPQEDEFALLALSGCSPYLGFAFPREQECFDPYLTMQEVSRAEIERWTEAAVWFARKLTVRGGGRRLVLKSPAHTARLRLLLELFPGARFVHVHRHPHDVFRSTRYMLLKLHPWFRLQRLDPKTLDEIVIRQYRSLHQAYFAGRVRLRSDQLAEVAFADLARDPIGTLQSVYEQLRLPPFDAAEPRIRRYVDTLGTYRTNRFEELPAALAERLAREWRESFEAWGYEPSGAGRPGPRAVEGDSRSAISS